MTVRPWIFALVIACGGGNAPAPTPASPASTTDQQALSMEPAASDGGAAPTTAQPKIDPPAEDPSCPPLEQYTSSLGKPCPTPDAFCGSARCRDAKGFCNIIKCKGGTWQNIEVPPPPPS